MSKGKTSRFNTDWLSREEYKIDYYQKNQIILKQNARCARRHFSPSNMGETAVISHAEGKKHTSSMKVSQRTVC